MRIFSALAALLLAATTTAAQTVTPSSVLAYRDGLCTSITCPTSGLPQAMDGDMGTGARLELTVGLLGGVGLTAVFAAAQPTTATAVFHVQATGLTLAEAIAGARIELISGSTVVATGTYDGALVSALVSGGTAARLSYGAGVSFNAARLVYASAVSALDDVLVMEAAADPVGSLPVELVSFAASADGPDGAVLRWTTASETNNAGFAVEQNTPTGWRERAFVPGRGTTSEATSYRHRVADLAPGRHALRLRQVDLDGTAHLSPTVEVVVGAAGALTVHAPVPHPARTSTRVSVDVTRGGHVAATLHDVLGRHVATLHDAPVPDATRLDLDIDAGALAPGAYVVRVRSGAALQTLPLTVVR